MNQIQVFVLLSLALSALAALNPMTAHKGRFFSHSSPFNTKIPKSAKTHHMSKTWVDFALKSGYLGHNDFWVGGTSTKNTGYNRALEEGGELAVYWATESDPVYTVYMICAHNTQWCGGGHVYEGMPSEGDKIHIPKGAIPAGGWGGMTEWNTQTSPPPEHYGHDSHMAVIQPNGFVYEFWQTWAITESSAITLFNMDLPAYSISALGGGKGPLNGDGISGGDFGAIAASWSMVATLIFYQEMEAADHNPKNAIPHALNFNIPYTHGPSVWPTPAGVNNGEPSSDARYPPMGARWQLMLSDAEISRLKIPKWKKALAYALAHYGAFVSDTWSAGNGCIGHIESSNSFLSLGLPSPWFAWAKKHGIKSYKNAFGTGYLFPTLTGVPLHKMRVVAVHH